MTRWNIFVLLFDWVLFSYCQEKSAEILGYIFTEIQNAKGFTDFQGALYMLIISHMNYWTTSD